MYFHISRYCPHFNGCRTMRQFSKTFWMWIVRGPLFLQELDSCWWWKLHLFPYISCKHNSYKLHPCLISCKARQLFKWHHWQLQVVVNGRPFPSFARTSGVGQIGPILLTPEMVGSSEAMHTTEQVTLLLQRMTDYKGDWGKQVHLMQDSHCSYLYTFLQEQRSAVSIVYETDLDGPEACRLIWTRS